MLGGGVFVTQTKTLPGSYINFVSGVSASSNLGERGTVAIALPLGVAPGTVIELTKQEFVTNGSDILGDIVLGDSSVGELVFREIFCHANKLYIYDNGSVAGTTSSVTDVIRGLESYDFNVLCCYSTNNTECKAYIDAVKSWRDDLGKKCQLVVYNQTNPNYEGVINVASISVTNPTTKQTDPLLLVAWVAGAMAGCKINESCTNMRYDGELTINPTATQSELEQYIENGQIAFHRVYGEIRLLEDINSLTETTVTKGEDFKSNQTIRVIDQIANDIAKLFNTKYLGKIPNNASGRVSLWGDIVKHHNELAALNAIESFDSSKLTVAQGNTKKSIVVNDVITVINAMSQLYMTVIVQ